MPRSLDKHALADALRYHQDLGCGNPANDSGNGVTVRTLAPDLRRDQVATVRFGSLPLALERLTRGGQMSLELQLQSSSLASGDKQDQPATLTIDDHFDGVTVLYSPRPECHDFDILAVPGLGSHAFGSFMHKEDGHMWLSDSLPEDASTFRVMIYGYRSPLPNNNSFGGIDDLASPLRSALGRISRQARKPILLLGHSLGGLLIKQALIRVSESKDDRDLLGFVVGWLFFGVPNDGMDIESLITIVRDQPNRSLVESLRWENSDFLRTQKDSFSTLISQHQFEMFCFHELEQSPTAEKV